jgi:hypothetical protein
MKLPGDQRDNKIADAIRATTERARDASPRYRYLDAQIAAEAARAAIFVAEDSGRLDRCALLLDTGCIQFQAMNVDAFLSAKDLSVN